MKIILSLVALTCCLTVFIVLSDSDDTAVIDSDQEAVESVETTPILTEHSLLEEDIVPVPSNLGETFGQEEDVERNTVPYPSSKEFSGNPEEVTEKSRPDETEFSWDVIDEWFVPNIPEGIERPVVDGADFTRKLQNGEGTKIPDWAILSFGEGVFDLTKTFTHSSFRDFSSGIIFEGAGMDKTLLIFEKGINFFGIEKVEGLTFRNLTLDANNSDIFEGRIRGAVSLDFEQVRIVRFDSGSGGSCLFYVQANPCTIRAKDSEFICGYGRGRRPGTLSGKDNFLAYFFNCRFEFMDFRLRKRENYQIRFDKCKFVNIREDETFTDKPDLSGTRNPSVIFNFCELNGLLEEYEELDPYQKNFEEFLSRFPNSD